jgi:hypothetical protein
VLRDRFTRYFGVWREADGGATAVFDPLFDKGTMLPGPGDPPLVSTRTYRPAHNLGHFRFLECSHLAPGSCPSGDLTHWDEIRFPFVPALTDVVDLARVEVVHDPEAPAQLIEESCRVDAGGTVVVSFSNVEAGYQRVYRLGHWGERSEALKPGRRRKTAKANQK